MDTINTNDPGNANTVLRRPFEEKRRIRGDQIEVFKIMHGYEGLDKNMFFRLKTGNKVRGHNWALAKEHFKLDIRKYAFSQRTVNEWNKLPGECSLMPQV